MISPILRAATEARGQTSESVTMTPSRGTGGGV